MRTARERGEKNKTKTTSFQDSEPILSYHVELVSVGDVSAQSK